MKICFVLLCAGSSSRMGEPKMLLPYRGKTLLTHIAEEAEAAFPDAVYVVTGSERWSIETTLLAANAFKKSPFHILHNQSWGEGMASSIRRGIRGICANGVLPDAVMIGVCDQPFVSTALLLQMVNVKTSGGKGIVGCAYDGVIGTPVLFDKKYFDELLLLQGAYGARKLLQKHAADVATVEFPQGGIDIDTPDDYKKIH
jgi:molybdenum cofactor cytidylyltransferase